MNFVLKTNEGKAESIVLLISVLWWCFNRRWMRDRGVRQKVLFRTSLNRTFFQRDLNQSNRHDTSWHVVSTGYFCVLVLWAIAISDFLPLKIYKKLGPPSSSIAFKANSHACLKYYTVWNQFFIKDFYIWIRFKRETLHLFFLINAMVFRKNSL